ncbi:vWA domain-containing protein [Mycoplasmatota bacterium WC30]
MTGFMKKFIVGFIFLSILCITGCTENSIDHLDGGLLEDFGGMEYVSVEVGSESAETASMTSGDKVYSSSSSISEVSSGIIGDISEEPVHSQVVLPDAGQLTASEWNDLNNYDSYLSLFETDELQMAGIFVKYYNKGYLDTLNMINVHFHNEEILLFGGKVELLSLNQEVIYTTYTNVFGNAYLFPKTDELDEISNIVITYNGAITSYDYTYNQEETSIDINADLSNTHKDIIELMFVIDTTGSMGDEIAFLQAELDNVISEVKSLNPNSVIKLALLFYRDLEGSYREIEDDYVTRFYDFTTNIESQQTRLIEQYANGGGDFPEAVSTALYEAVNKNWTDENSTKLIFHVLDAPPHENQESMLKYCDALKIASEKGIRIIPIASSGINKFTEYLLRNEAMLTGGTYVYLTDDSGIGRNHIEASVGEVKVELLNELLVRLIIEYHTGAKPIADLLIVTEDTQQ